MAKRPRDTQGSREERGTRSRTLFAAAGATASRSAPRAGISAAPGSADTALGGDRRLNVRVTRAALLACTWATCERRRPSPTCQAQALLSLTNSCCSSADVPIEACMHPRARSRKRPARLRLSIAARRLVQPAARCAVACAARFPSPRVRVLPSVGQMGTHQGGRALVRALPAVSARSRHRALVSSVARR